MERSCAITPSHGYRIGNPRTFVNGFPAALFPTRSCFRTEGCHVEIFSVAENFNWNNHAVLQLIFRGRRSRRPLFVPNPRNSAVKITNPWTKQENPSNIGRIFYVWRIENKKGENLGFPPFFWWALQGSSLDFINSPSALFGRRFINKIKALQTKTTSICRFCLAALSVRSCVPNTKKAPWKEAFYGGHYRDRTCDPYRVNGVMCLFIKHYFCLLVAYKWLISAKNLYMPFLQS